MRGVGPCVLVWVVTRAAERTEIFSYVGAGGHCNCLVAPLYVLAFSFCEPDRIVRAPV